jgi:hypothetical protein
MKKKLKKPFKILPIIMLVLLIAGLASAQTWHTANQQTVAWDAVTEKTDGTPLDPAEVSYRVYMYNAVSDPNHAAPVKLGDTAETQYLITLGVEGKYFVGVSTIRTVDGEEIESEIAWSSDPAYDFGIRYYLAGKKPGGLNLP